MNEKAKKYIEDNTLDLDKSEKMRHAHILQDGQQIVLIE